ncbi:MAG TPA: cyclic nucleotide-binding domain-containing protein [Desulfobacterales bacterium]|nr:cyclic nucleotide-binding domain-containing protein [Desulfobacterales bacterium]
MVEIDDFKKFDTFSVFSEDQLAELSKITTTITFEKGAQIYREDDRANQFFLVIKGMVTLNKIDPGEKIGISFEKRERGGLFGAACFMEPQKYTLNAICMQDSEVMSIDADKLFELVQKDPDLGYKLMKEVAKIYFERYKVAKRQIHAMVKAPTIITASPG